MKIAIISQVRAGHVAAYHRLYVEEFRAAGCQVLDIGPPPPAGVVGRAVRQLERWPWWRGRCAWKQSAQRLRDAEENTPGESAAVFFPYLDVGYLEAAVSPEEIDRWFPRRWAGVVTGPAAVRRRGCYPGGERVLAARSCQALVVTDETFLSACRDAWPGKPVLVMPEVADVSPPAILPEITALRSWVGTRRLVGLLGVISAKKNIAKFLTIARRALVARPDLAFVVAGDFSDQACPGPERRTLARLLADLPANCRFHPAPIADGPQFNGWVAACDCLWLAYRDVVYKSNVLTKAAHFQRPVLVNRGGVMAAHTVQYRLGEVVDPGNPEMVLAALDRLLLAPAGGRSFGEFSAANSQAKLADTVRSILAAFRA